MNRLFTLLFALTLGTQAYAAGELFRICDMTLQKTPLSDYEIEVQATSCDTTDQKAVVGSIGAAIKATATYALTGTIDPAASATVTGVGTAFTTELLVGDRITVSGETRTVITITNDTTLTVHAAFSDNANDTTPDRLPAPLRWENSSGSLLGLGQVGGAMYLVEQADAGDDLATFGQVWVNTATPNELFFTDDAGTDFQLGEGTIAGTVTVADSASASLFCTFVDTATGDEALLTDASGCTYAADTGALSTTIFATGADPADAGAIRLSNAEVIGWEDGTEATITHVDDTGFSINLALDVVGALSGGTLASDNGLTLTTGTIIGAYAGTHGQIGILTGTSSRSTINFKGTTAGDAGVQYHVGQNIFRTDGTFEVYNNGGAGVYLTNGGTSWTASSDERSKNIIEPITNAVAKVGQLRSVIGVFKSDPDQKRHPFLIAQDVQKVLPEAVSSSPNEPLGLQYTEVIPLLVAALNEQAKSIESLEAEIEQLK